MMSESNVQVNASRMMSESDVQVNVSQICQMMSESHIQVNVSQMMSEPDVQVNASQMMPESDLQVNAADKDRPGTDKETENEVKNKFTIPDIAQNVYREEGSTYVLLLEDGYKTIDRGRPFMSPQCWTAWTNRNRGTTDAGMMQELCITDIEIVDIQNDPKLSPIYQCTIKSPYDNLEVTRTGPSKKEAKQNASRHLLNLIGTRKLDAFIKCSKLMKEEKLKKKKKKNEDDGSGDGVTKQKQTHQIFKEEYKDIPMVSGSGIERGEDYVGRLKYVCFKHGLGRPSYKILGERGVSSSPIVKMEGRVFGVGPIDDIVVTLEFSGKRQHIKHVVAANLISSILKNSWQIFWRLKLWANESAGNRSKFSEDFFEIRNCPTGFPMCNKENPVCGVVHNPYSNLKYQRIVNCSNEVKKLRERIDTPAGPEAMPLMKKIVEELHELKGEEATLTFSSFFVNDSLCKGILVLTYDKVRFGFHGTGKTKEESKFVAALSGIKILREGNEDLSLVVKELTQLTVKDEVKQAIVED